MNARPEILPTMKEAQAMLHRDMRRGTDDRWDLLKVEPMARKRSIWPWIAPAFVAVGIIAIVRGLGG